MPMFTNTPIVSLRKTPINTQQSNCRKYAGFLPTMNPSISSLSTTISAPQVYSLVYISGHNFIPYNTTVTFGPIKNIDVVFYSSSYISFVVPLNVSERDYTVQVVVNYYNIQSQTSNLLYSNKLNYTIKNYVITGDYNTDIDDKYNTIIHFTTNGTIIFYNKFNILWNIKEDAYVLVNGKILKNGLSQTFVNTQYFITLNSGSVSLNFIV
jgi:hypothetical protein